MPGRRGDAVLLPDRGRRGREGDLDQRPALFVSCRTRSSTASEFNAACSCKQPGQSWADALGKDEAVEPGDIVVTEDRAKQIALPPAQKGQAKGRAPAAATPRAGGRAASAAAAAAEPPAAAAAETDPAKRSIRSVGPTFIPPRVTAAP